MSKAVKRYHVADYLECGTSDAKEYCLCGVGYKSLDEEPQAQTSDTIYIHNKNSSSEIDSYQTQFPFEADFFNDEKAVREVWDIGHDQKVGEDAQRNYVRVDLYDPVSAEEGTYRARQFVVAIEVSSLAGEAGKTMTVSGNFKTVGDFVAGKFNTKTKEFTPDTTVTTTEG